MVLFCSWQDQTSWHEVVDRFCPGSGTSDTIECVDCVTECQPGSYLSSVCLGNGRMDTSQCSPCRTSCESGYYMTGTCDSRATFTDPVKCIRCKLNCSVDYYMSGYCNGTEPSDSIECIKVRIVKCAHVQNFDAAACRSGRKQVLLACSTSLKFLLCLLCSARPVRRNTDSDATVEATATMLFVLLWVCRLPKCRPSGT